MPRRAFIDRPVTDVVAATRAARRAADRWHLDDPILLRMGMNAIFTSGSVVLRVSEPSVPAEASFDLAGLLADSDIAVPAAVRGDVVTDANLSVTAWDRIVANDEPIDWVQVGRMVRRVHRLGREAIPPSVPLPLPESFPWWDFGALLDRADAGLDAAAKEGLVAAIDRHRGWYETAPRVVCHGDVHPGNVIMTDDGPVLIDWDLLCWGPPGWDHGPMMTWEERWGGVSGEYAAFAEGYGQSLRGSATAEAIAELRLAAATLMRVAAGLHDEDAMVEAQRRLSYWRGEPDAPMWTAQ